MSNLVGKRFDNPDETRTPPKTTLEVVDLHGVKAGRMTAQPGWRWSECIKPVAGTDSCQARHIGAVISGTLHVRHDDGTELDLEPGAAYRIEPGHDAWVIGDEPYVGYEFESATAGSYGGTS